MGRFEEILVILVVALLLFGPNKLTDLAKAMGGALREFKKAANGDEDKPQNAAAEANPGSHRPVRHAKPSRRSSTKRVKSHR